MVARLWLLILEFANITDEALDSSSTKSSVTVTVTLSPSLAVLVRNDEDAGPHVLRVLLWLLMPTVLDADDKDTNAST